MAEYTTQFTQQLGASNEVIDVLINYGQDFTGDGFNDIKVTLSLNSGSNSGTDDMLGVAFDINNDAVTGLQIVDIQRSEQSPTQTLSTYVPAYVIGANQISNLPLVQGTQPDFVLDGATPFDVAIQFSDQGLSDGIVQTASFVIKKENTNLEKTLLENTDWYIRLQSTDGGQESAKTGGSIGTIGGGFTPNPGISINKLTNGFDGKTILKGSPVTWTYAVTNTGNVALSNVAVTDDQLGTITSFSGDTDNDGLLDLTETWTYSKTGTAVAGNYSNIGTVTGKYNGTTVTDDDPSNYFGANPSLDVEKFVSVDGGATFVDADSPTGPFALSGTNPQFKFVVTNTGNVALTNVNLTDSDFNLSLAPFNLAVGGTYETTFTGATWQAGQHTNTATATSTYTDGGGNSKNLSDTDDANYFGADPKIAINKVTNGADGQTILAGSPVTWTYTVSNAGNVAVSNINVTDDQGVTPVYQSGDTDNDTLLDLGENWIYTATGTATAGDYSNIGTATGKFNNTPVNATDPSNYFGANPSLDVEKLVSVDGGATFVDADNPTGPFALSGTNPQFKFVVTNTGNVALTNVNLTDSDFNLSLAPFNLAVGGTYETTFTGATWQAGQHTNTATATSTYTDGGGNSKNLSDTDDANYFGADPKIAINKVTNGADGQTILAGSPVTWTYTVSNAGNVALSSINVTDDQGVTPVYQSGDSNSNSLLDLGENWIYKATGTATVGNYSNIGTATGSFNNTPVSATDPSNYFGANPGINIDKVTNNGAVQGDGLLIQQGSAIDWLYTVTNTGNVALSNVSVTDNKLAAGAITLVSGDTNSDGKLDLTESWLYKASGTAITGSYQNTGTATGSFTDSLGTTKPVTDSDDSSYTGVVSPGARTPGFWKNWAAVWDGNATNDSTFKGRAGFPLSDILLAPYSSFKDTDNDGKVDTAIDPVTGTQELGILVGDWNKNGVTDGTEKTIFYTLNEAMTIISADQKTQQDKRYTLDRSLIASWLNYLGVNPAPTGDINQAIEWMQRNTPNENAIAGGDGNLVLGASTWAVPASSSAWANPSDVFNGLPTGEILNAKLDYYNNTGSFGVQPV